MEKVTLESVLRRDDDILESDLGNEKVMMSIEHGQYYGLNETGREIYDRCDGKATLAEVCEQLQAEFEIEAADCQEQVVRFAAELVNRGLLHPL